MKQNSIFFVCVIAMLLFAIGVAVAFTVYTDNFNLEYGTAGTVGSGTLGSCITCHVNPTDGGRNS